MTNATASTMFSLYSTTTMAVKNFAYIYFITTLLIHKVSSIIPPSYRVNASEAPFMVYVSRPNRYCGGVILSENIVLTANHCTIGTSIQVAAGQSVLESDRNMQTVRVEKTLSHDNYSLDPNGIQAYNDIGLLLLQTPFTFNQYVQPIELTNNADFEEPAITYGWGSTNAFRNFPSFHLRAKNISLIPDNLCIEMLNKAITKCNKQVYEICAEKGTCMGDSGGPIVQKVNNVTKLVGILSWGADDNTNCDTAPSVFENVSYFSEWIKDGMKTLLEGKATESQDDKENIIP